MGADGMRFRIFRRQGWRRAFRLEQAFWDALDQAAAAEGLRLADFVRDITAGLDPGDNASSRLRVEALARLGSRCRVLESRLATDRPLAAALAAPVPAFALGRDLLRWNDEFAGLMEMEPSGADAEAGRPHVALDAPVERIAEILGGADGKTLTCGFVARSGDRRRTGRARMVLLRQGEDLLVGYVLPGPAGAEQPPPAAPGG